MLKDVASGLSNNRVNVQSCMASRLSNMLPLVRWWNVVPQNNKYQRLNLYCNETEPESNWKRLPWRQRSIHDKLQRLVELDRFLFKEWSKCLHNVINQKGYENQLLTKPCGPFSSFILRSSYICNVNLLNKRIMCVLIMGIYWHRRSNNFYI